MKIISPLLILFALGIMGCQTTDTNPVTVEHILMPHPVPEDGWTLLNRRDGTTEWNRWQKESEFLSLAITRVPPRVSVQNQRDAIDAHARDNIAKTFDSSIIINDRIGFADRTIWRTELEFPDGRIVYSLFTLLHGNDASYFITKQWDSAEEYASEYDSWLSYLKSIKVADPRLKEMSEQGEGGNSE